MNKVAFALIVYAAACCPAAAQTYPTKTVRVIVPYSIGGLDASSEQGSRLRDANVRESAAAPVLVAQASIPREQYPNRTVRIIVPYSIGGGTDIITRVVTQKLSEMWGQQIVVDNRAGGGTVIGTQLAANAAADGYTLFVSAPSFVINPTTRPELPYDVLKAFRPITVFAY